MLSERKITSLHVYIHTPESKTSLGSNGRIQMSTTAKYQGQHGGARIPLVGLFYIIRKSSKENSFERLGNIPWAVLWWVATAVFSKDSMPLGPW